jgi:RND family efflux transporter MFP subunit
MNIKILMAVLILLSITACNQHLHEAEDSEKHEESKVQYISYSTDFELFAEADAFVAGETANVLSHFSTLPDFKAVESGSIALVLTAGGVEFRQTLDKPTRKGIYSFDVKPEASGEGALKFEISTQEGIYVVEVPGVIVYNDHDEARQAIAGAVVSRTNTAVFTKEQSWKVEFSTEYPKTEPFGPIIKTTALVQPAPEGEIIISARTSGIVAISANDLLAGREVTPGMVLLTISGNEFAENNSMVRYAEAKSNFEKASSDYERAKELAKDKIVSEKELMASKNRYDNAKAVFDNLNLHFTASGQSVTSPLSGYVKQMFVKNGAYVSAGQPILTVSRSRTLILTADVAQKFLPLLGVIFSANIRTLHDNQVYTFEQLNGKVLSYGKAANSDNYLIPVSLQIDNPGSFTPGSFVEVYLKTRTNSQALTVPNTALLEEQGNYFVWVQLTPELFEKREVEVGHSDGVKTEIFKGIQSNDRIVAHGAMLIKLAQATGALDAHSGHVH